MNLRKGSKVALLPSLLSIPKWLSESQFFEIYVVAKKWPQMAIFELKF